MVTQMFHYKIRKPFSMIRLFNAVFVISMLCLVPLTQFDNVVMRSKSKYSKIIRERSLIYNETIERYFETRKYWQTSNLGSILFKNQPIKYSPQNRTFQVLFWKHWYWWKGRHVKSDPFDKCSVNNCVFVGDDSLIRSVDAVVIHLMKAEFPWVHKRNMSQRWVFLTEESPINTFIGVTPEPSLSSIANIFNWSMTYRSDSDVPIPYGRTIPLPEVLMLRRSSHSITRDIPYWESKQRDVLVAALISRCYIHERMNYINELKKYINVDVFGNCGDTEELRNGCPGNSEIDCPKINNYLFYLAFENSRCRQYLTEKIFHSAFAKGAIPVVMGPPESDCEKLLPPHSFLHVNSFNSPRDLAMEILHLSTNDEYLEMFHKWRHYFSIVNEHGFLGTKSYQLCRLCEALNFNDNQTKVYDEDALKLFLDAKLLCTT